MRNGKARPSPRAANTSTDPAGGSRSAVPKAAPRNGPAHGVATNAASAPVPKPPAGRIAPPSTGTSSRPIRFAVIAGREQQQQHDRPWVLQLERPTRLRPRCPNCEKRDPKRAGPDHRADRVRKTVRPRVLFIFPGAGEVQRLQCQDRKHARIRLRRIPPTNPPSTATQSGVPAGVRQSGCRSSGTRPQWRGIGGRARRRSREHRRIGSRWRP